MLKRLVDLILGITAAILLSPILVITAILVHRKLGSPVFFTQVRPGKDGKPFKMVKFRTMRDATDAQGNPLPDAERLTPFGRRLRSTSIDELPELWNVIKGEMSLVGPRPLLMDYLPLYSPEQAKRHDLKPGMTGHAQVNGRNAISWDEKFKLDTWYVQNRSTWLDFKIMLKTVHKVLSKDDINAEGDVIMPRFTGSTPGEDL